MLQQMKMLVDKNSRSTRPTDLGVGSVGCQQRNKNTSKIRSSVVGQGEKARCWQVLFATGIHWLLNLSRREVVCATLTRWLDRKRCHLRPTPQLANQKDYIWWLAQLYYINIIVSAVLKYSGVHSSSPKEVCEVEVKCKSKSTKKGNDGLWLIPIQVNHNVSKMTYPCTRLL